MTIRIAALACIGSLISVPALAVDWNGVAAKQVVLFYPGQTSWEYLLSTGEHSGALKFRDGKGCHNCHEDEEKTQGPLLISGQKNEPAPIPGKPGFITANIKMAQDDKALYVRLEFDEGQQPDLKMDPDWSTKVTMMIADAKVPEGARAGCWVTCHDDAARMAGGAVGDRTKYLGKTRAKLSRGGGGDELKPADELAKLSADGYVMEYWQAKISPTGKASAVAGTIFDKRQELKNPQVTAEVTGAKGNWAVTLSRPLAAGAPYKELAPGKPYTIGFAIHSGHSAKRFHYVSYEHSLVLGQGNADFVAAKK